jgi:hypothetical protein
MMPPSPMGLNMMLSLKGDMAAGEAIWLGDMRRL